MLKNSMLAVNLESLLKIVTATGLVVGKITMQINIPIGRERKASIRLLEISPKNYSTKYEPCLGIRN